MIFHYSKGFFNNRFSPLIFLFLFIPFLFVNDGHLDLSNIFFLPFFLFSVYLVIIYKFEIRVFEDYTVFKDVFGQHIIPNNEIGYTEFYTIREKSASNKDGQTLKLSIYLPFRKIVILQDEEPKYEDFLRLCRTQFTKKEKNRLHIKYYLIPIALFIIQLSPFVLSNGSTDIAGEQNQLVKLDVTVKTFAKKGRRNYKEIVIELREFPEFEFHIQNSDKKAFRKYYELLKKERSIAIHISEYDFKKKLQKTEKLTFSDKYFGYPDVTVHKLESITASR